MRDKNAETEYDAEYERPESSSKSSQSGNGSNGASTSQPSADEEGKDALRGILSGLDLSSLFRSIRKATWCRTQQPEKSNAASIQASPQEGCIWIQLQVPIWFGVVLEPERHVGHDGASRRGVRRALVEANIFWSDCETSSPRPSAAQRSIACAVTLQSPLQICIFDHMRYEKKLLCLIKSFPSKVPIMCLHCSTMFHFYPLNGACLAGNCVELLDNHWTDAGNRLGDSEAGRCSLQ